MEKATTDTFKSIENTSLVDKVEANLVELLQQQKLKIGDSIPTELNWQRSWELAEL